MREGREGTKEERKERFSGRSGWWAGMLDGLINISGWMNAWIKT